MPILNVEALKAQIFKKEDLVYDFQKYVRLEVELYTPLAYISTKLDAY